MRIRRLPMIRISRVAADAGDLRAIVPAGTSIARNVFLGVVPVSALVFAVAYLVSRTVWVAAAGAAAMAIASSISNVRFFRGVARRRQQSDVQSVETIDVEAFHVVDIEPLGSHGPALVFFAEDGKALLLIGQWLLDQPSFPSRSFQVRRWADTGKPIRIEVRGPEIDPESSAVQLPPSSRIGDIGLFDATPGTLERDLQRAFG
jgi:hypothetical protein